MSDGWSALLLCAVATAVNVVVQMVVHRTTKGYVRSFLVGFVAGLAVLLAGEGLRRAGHATGFLAAAVVIAADGLLYACACFLYFGFVNVGESSIRMRLLRELSRMAPPALEADLLTTYNDRMILQIRLGRMVRNGQVTFVDGRYHVQSGVLVRIAAVVFGLKMLLLGRSSEFAAESHERL